MPYIFNNSKEKAEATKELTAIKKVLLELVKNGILWGCYPSWVTTRLTKAETLKQINKIIKALKEEIKETYTSRTYKQTNKTIKEIMEEYETNEKRRRKELMEG